jgi:DNA-binding CsgD family transcriptional regulator
MGKRHSGTVDMVAVALDEIRGETGPRAFAAAVRRRVSPRARRIAIDFVAAPLIAGVILATLFTEAHEVMGMPFMFAIPVWLIARARGAVPGMIVAALLAVTTWILWHDATLVARVNISLIVLLALLAGLDGRRRVAAQALIASARAREDEQRSSEEEQRSSLTKREHDVLRLLGTGHTNKEVAAQLGLSVRTIESHRARIVTKLGSSGRADLYRHALELGLLEPEAAAPAAAAAS